MAPHPGDPDGDEVRRLPRRRFYLYRRDLGLGWLALDQSPSSTALSTWTGTLPFGWPVGGEPGSSLGNGFVALQLVRREVARAVHTSIVNPTSTSQAA